jgi:hypothetical protein
MASSNIGQVTAWLEGWVDSFNFARPGKDQSLGRDIAMKVVDRIQTRSLTDRKGAKDTWPPNSEKPSRWHPEGYRKWKDDNYGIGEPNSRTGQMLSQLSLYGRTRIDSKLITMIYGINQPPTRATFGDPGEKNFERDKKVTDTFKAYLAHTGQSRQQIKRPFYEVDESDGQAVMELCQENLAEYITDTNRANDY